MDTASTEMREAEAGAEPGGASQAAGEPYRVRLPGFLLESDEELGLGDVIKRATSAVGIAPCGGCAARAAALNRWFVFSGGHS